MPVLSKVILDSQMFRVFVEQTAEWIPPASYPVTLYASLSPLCHTHILHSFQLCLCNNMGTGSLGFLLEPICFIPCAILRIIITFGCAIPRVSESSGCSHTLCHFMHGSHLWLCNTQGVSNFQRVFIPCATLSSCVIPRVSSSSYPVPLYAWFSSLAV